jgi:hypothetical protein
LDGQNLLFRNMDVNEVIGEAADFLLHNFALITTIVIAANVPLFVWQVFALAQPESWDIPFRYRSGRDLATVAGLVNTLTRQRPSGAQLASLVISGVVALLQSGALAYALSKRYAGESVHALDALSEAGRRLPALAVGMGMPALIVVVSALAAARLPGTDFDLVPFIAVMLALYPRWLLVPQALMSEGLRGIAAIRRSFALTRGYFWYVLVIWLIAELLLTLATLVPTFVVGIASVSLPVATLRLLNVVTTNFVAIVIDPFFNVVIVFLYFQLRRRKERYPPSPFDRSNNHV